MSVKWDHRPDKNGEKLRHKCGSVWDMQEAPFKPGLKGSCCSRTVYVGTWWRMHHDVSGVLDWTEVCGMGGQSHRPPPANPILDSSCLINCPLVFVPVVQTPGEIDSQTLLKSMIELELHWDWLRVPFILLAGNMLFVWLLKTFWYENAGQYFPK